MKLAYAPEGYVPLTLHEAGMITAQKLDDYNKTGCTNKDHTFCNHKPKKMLKSNVEQFLEWEKNNG